MMRVSDFSHLARPLDVFYPTNAVIIVLILLSAGFGSMTGGADLAGKLAIGVFMVWALAREFSPQHEYWAFVSVGAWLAIVSVFGAFAASVAPAVGVLMYMRVLNRTSGGDPTAIDWVMLAALSGWLLVNWWAGWWLCVIGALFAYVYVTTCTSNTKYPVLGDSDEKKLLFQRVRAAQLFGIFFISILVTSSYHVYLDQGIVVMICCGAVALFGEVVAAAQMRLKDLR